MIYDTLFKKHGLSITQQEIIKLIGKNKIILEIGAATGYMTQAFINNDSVIDAVEENVEASSKIPKGARKIINKSIEDKKTYSLLSHDYDYIVLADVLEHLVNPELILRNLLEIALVKTKLVISIPNIACWSMRKQLFFKGDFEYQESGLLDKTHLHFYTVKTLPAVLSNNGWKVDKLEGTVMRLPLEGLISRIPFLGLLLKEILYALLVNRYKNLAYYHFFVVASKR